jgi:hypothetical protein
VVPLIVSLVMVVGCVSGVWYLYLHHQTFWKEINKHYIMYNHMK